jgi:hypothetical protein
VKIKKLKSILATIIQNQPNRSIPAGKILGASADYSYIINKIGQYQRKNHEKNFFVTTDNFTDQQKLVNTALKGQRILDKRLIIFLRSQCETLFTLAALSELCFYYSLPIPLEWVIIHRFQGVSKLFNIKKIRQIVIVYLKNISLLIFPKFL